MKNPPSLRDIAEKAGVAKSTVSMALRNDPRIAPARRKRIQKLAAQMGYQANALISHLMFELRKGRKQQYVATIAVINANPVRDMARRVSQIANLLDGIHQRAGQQGYSLDHFWLHQPGVKPESLARILRARGIQGIIFYAIRDESDFAACQPLWEGFACITIGAHFKKPPLNFVLLDHHFTTLRACEQLRRIGYRRTGMVINRWVDQVMERRMTAGYLASFPESEKAPPILLLDNPSDRPVPNPQGKEKTMAWIRKHRLDSCVCNNNFILDWVREMKLDVPREMGIVLLDLPREYRGRAAGMESRQEWSGMIAVDMLIGMIHRGERGIPPFQFGSVVESHWVHGPTVRGDEPER